MLLIGSSFLTAKQLCALRAAYLLFFNTSEQEAYGMVRFV